MHYKTLLGSVLGIVLVLTGIYFTLNGTQKSDGTSESIAREPELVEESTPTLDAVTEPTADVELEIAEKEEEEDEVIDETTAVKPAVQEPVSPEPEPVIPKKSGYSLADVRAHASESSCWSIIGESVYDLTPFIGKHPGGEKRILRICGSDGTDAFMGEHGGDSKPENMLERYRVGAYSG